MAIDQPIGFWRLEHSITCRFKRVWCKKLKEEEISSDATPLFHILYEFVVIWFEFDMNNFVRTVLQSY